MRAYVVHRIEIPHEEREEETAEPIDLSTPAQVGFPRIFRNFHSIEFEETDRSGVSELVVSCCGNHQLAYSERHYSSSPEQNSF